MDYFTHPKVYLPYPPYYITITNKLQGICAHLQPKISLYDWFIFIDSAGNATKIGVFRVHCKNIPVDAFMSAGMFCIYLLSLSR